MLRNCWLKWFENRLQSRRLIGRSLSGRSSGRRSRTTLASGGVPAYVGELLEERTLLTTFVVDTTVDVSDGNFSAGNLSLREAMELAQANPGGDIIRFSTNLNGAVFNITSGPLPTITQDLQILGAVGNAQTINGAGLIVNAAGAGNSTTLIINSVNINLAPTGAGLTINAVNDGTANVTVANARITNNAAQGLKFVAHTGGVVNLNLTAVSILSNGDVTPGEGILGQVGVGTGAQSLTMPAKFATANLNFNTVRVGGQFLEGFKLDVATGGQVTTTAPILNSTFSDNGAGNSRAGVDFNVTGTGSSLQADFDNVTIDRATGTAFDFAATSNAQLDIGIVNSRGSQSKADGLHFTIDNATATISVDGFTANNAGDNGVEVILSNGAIATVSQMNNVAVTLAKNSGLQVGVLSGSNLLAFNATTVSSINTGGSGALLTTLASQSNFNFTNLVVTGNTIRGVQIGVNDTGTSTKTFTNITATGNKLAQPMGIGVRNTSVLNLAVNGGTMTSNGALGGINNVFAPIALGSTANMTFTGLNMNGSTSSGIVASYETNSNGTLNVSNTTSTGNRAVGIAVFALTGGDVDANFNNVNVSNAGQAAAANGIRLDVIGAGSTGDFTFNGVTANGATGTGISLLYNAGATGTVSQFNNVSAQNTGGDGVNVNVRGALSKLTTFNATGVNVTGAGLGTVQTADGLDITVAGPGAMGTFSIANLTANGAGGRGVKVQGENTATLALNVNGFSADNNDLEGIAIDLGTVVAGTQMLGAVFANGTASSNGQAFMQTRSGIRTTVRGAGTNASIAFDALFTNSNTADGFELSGAAGATFSADVRNGSAALGNAMNGIDFTGDGATTTVSLTSSVPGNVFTGNVQDGVNVTLTNGVTANDVTIRGSASLNQGDGIQITANDATGVTINNLQVTGNNPELNGNMGNGLIIDLNSVTGINTLDLSSLSVNDNVLDQVNVTLTNMTLTTVSLANIVADGPGAGVGNGDGVELTLNNTTITTALSLNGITAVNNGEDGLQLNFLNGASIPASSAIDIGTFDDNGQHGVNLNVNASTVALSITNSNAAMGAVSSMSGNGMHGLNVELFGATLTMDEVDGQTITGNSGAGINIQSAVPSNFNSGNSFTNNTVSDNGSFGFRGIFNGGTFDIAIGEVGGGNSFSNNVGAAISVDMVQNTVGRLSIDSNVIIGTNNNPANPSFNGEGIFIRQLGTVNPAQATSSLQSGMGPGLLIQNNRIGVDAMGVAAGNTSFGITFQSEEQSNISGLHIFDNNISNNGNDAISFRRFDQVTVTDFRIEANIIDANSGDGIELTGENDTTALMSVIIGPDAPTAAQLMTDSVTTSLPTAPDRGNTITNNSGDGIRLQINADARMNVNIRDNFIVNNNDDGIGLNEIVLDASDQRQISGVWVQNIIADNGDRGVELSAVTFGNVVGGDGFLVFDIRDGATPAQGIFARENTIGAVLDQFGQVLPGQDGNGSTGIEINGAGVTTWIDTQILRNGREREADRTVGHGIDIQGVGKDVVLDNNLIRENFQDGTEFNAAGTSFINLDMYRNRTQLNNGRGLDILTQQLADSRIRILDGSTLVFSNGAPTATRNILNSNVEEGVYFVISADAAQGQSAFASTGLTQGGSVTNSFSTASLVIDQATISNNGSTAVGNLVATAGLSVRVGTQDAPNVLSTGPHFATSGVIGASGHPTFFNNGGAFLQLTNSTLQGNFGDDVFIHSYRSTVDPGTIGGTWDATTFAPTNTAQGDPLARLDVVWGTATTGNANIFDSVDLINSLRRGTPDGQAGAFYNDSDGTFKSRTSNLTPGGPFAQNGGPARRRTATRAPVRTYSGGLMLGPMNGTSFQYPGMGDSTFRVMTGVNTSIATDLDLFSGGVGFIFDDNPTGGDFSPIESFNEANGVGYVGGGTFGELPFGWGTF